MKKAESQVVVVQKKEDSAKKEKRSRSQDKHGSEKLIEVKAEEPKKPEVIEVE